MEAITAAQIAIEAWRKGESAKSYADFRRILSPHFELFSHPILGQFDGESARHELDKLMNEQEQLINELVFSDIRFFRNGHTVLVMFNCRGTVMGGRWYYKGPSVICFRFDDDGKIMEFRILPGTINEDWFKPETAPDLSE
ncbi:MAG: hypothetical protein INR69_00780 [Mucilaginibacter polytrichastri]|nr:hypothetical protein [Mucilaginibacter polytrichastri]